MLSVDPISDGSSLKWSSTFGDLKEVVALNRKVPPSKFRFFHHSDKLHDLIKEKTDPVLEDLNEYDIEEIECEDDTPLSEVFYFATGGDVIKVDFQQKTLAVYNIESRNKARTIIVGKTNELKSFRVIEENETKRFNIDKNFFTDVSSLTLLNLIHI